VARRLGIVLAVAALVAGAVGYAQRYGLDADSRFRHWLERAPGVVSIDRFEPRHPASAGSSEKPTVPAPSAEVTVAGPLTPAGIAPFQRAFEAYAADHGEDFRSFSVQATAGGTTMIVTPDRPDNERRSTVLAAFQSLPRLVGARVAWSPWPAETVAVLPAQADLLPAAREVQRRLAAVNPQPRSWGEGGSQRGPLLAFRVAGTRHQLAVDTASVPTPRALRAFSVAVDREVGRGVELAVGLDGRDPRALLSLDPESPTSAATAAAVNAVGFGIPGHDEEVRGAGSRGTAPFDATAWRAAALPPVRAVAGVQDARLDLEDEGRRAVLDVRLGAGATPATLTAVAAVVPAGTDTVLAHTAPSALDPDRDTTLPEDPQQSCPAGPAGAVDTAYGGPVSELAAAAGLMSQLVDAAPVSCAHWQLPSRAAPDRAPILTVRLPGLEEAVWRPALDALADAGSRGGTGDLPATRVALVLPAVDRPWTAMLLVTPGDPDAYPSTLVADSPAQMREAFAALEPLMTHWRSAVTGR
jgi:hypothetical protein